MTEEFTPKGKRVYVEAMKKYRMNAKELGKLKREHLNEIAHLEKELKEIKAAGHTSMQVCHLNKIGELELQIKLIDGLLAG